MGGTMPTPAASSQLSRSSRPAKSTAARPNDKDHPFLNQSFSVVEASSLTAAQIVEGEEREVEESMYIDNKASQSNWNHQEQRMEHHQIFHSIDILHRVKIYDEPLYASVTCYHHQYDPNSDYNLLIDYGAVDRVLPETTVEMSMTVRDVVIRWEWPHLELEWERLPEVVAELAQKCFHPEDMH
jgi:hypothetical protein